MRKFGVSVLLLAFVLAVLTGCAPKDWKQNFDASLDLAEPGWHVTLYDEFVATADFPEGDVKLNPAVWTTSPHGLRKTEYWCDQMVEVRDGKAVIRSERQTDHDCPYCVDKEGNPVREGIFTGGIEGREIVVEDGKRVEKQLFSQAFGYFEASVKVPRGDAMWSAFWLQSLHEGKIGNGGRDGTEIDVYESAFFNENKTKSGNAVHYNGYDSIFYRSEGSVSDVGYDLYDGEFHTYGLKWTPDEYVFYVDGTPVWATDEGGVSEVPQFLRLTVEIREDTYGPYAQKFGKFRNAEDGSTDFEIDYVRVYQNDAFVPFIRADEDFRDQKSLYEGLMIGGGILIVLILAGGVWLTAALVRKKKRGS